MLLVDHHSHALLTVARLAAVDPNGVCVVDLHRENRDAGVVRGDRHEA